MTPDQQLARSLRFSSPHQGHVIDLGDGLFALFLPGGSFEHVIGTWAEIGEAFVSRPQYVPRIRAPLPSKFANLEFNI
jgi:hypothetical protein